MSNNVGRNHSNISDGSLQHFCSGVHRVDLC